MGKKIKGLNDIIREMDDTPAQQGLRILNVRLAFATCLARARSEDPVHIMELSHQFVHAKEDELELEEADFTALRAVVVADLGYTNLVKAPLVVILNAAEVPLALPKQKQEAS